MDYENKYNSALERARNYYKGLAPCRAKDELELIFPELRESEDERIRKALVWHLKADVDFVSNGVTKAECIAYLEKQKEQKPISQEDFDTAKHEALWEEQKPAEYNAFKKWVEDYWSHNKNPYSYNKGDEVQFDHKGFVSFCEAYCYPQNLVLHDTFGYEEGRQTGQNEGVKLVLDNPEKYGLQKEQKPTSTEEMPYITDEHFYEREPADSFKYKLAEYMTKCCTKKEGPYGYEYGISAESILKMAEEELLKRGVVQKPAECIEDSVKFEEGFKAGRESGLRDGQKYVLNNLDSYGLCKPAEWKPSEEQMDALAYAIQILDDVLSLKAAKAGEELEHLREQLKKL